MNPRKRLVDHVVDALEKAGELWPGAADALQRQVLTTYTMAGGSLIPDNMALPKLAMALEGPHRDQYLRTGAKLREADEPLYRAITRRLPFRDGAALDERFEGRLAAVPAGRALELLAERLGGVEERSRLLAGEERTTPSNLAEVRALLGRLEGKLNAGTLSAFAEKLANELAGVTGPALSERIAVRLTWPVNAQFLADNRPLSQPPIIPREPTDRGGATSTRIDGTAPANPGRLGDDTGAARGSQPRNQSAFT